MMPLCTTATDSSVLRCGCALRSVGGPCVAQRVCAMPTLPRHRVGRERPLELRDLPRGAARLDRLAIEHGDAGRVIAAILESLQPLDQERRGLHGADVADDTAHKDRCEV